MAWAGYQKTFFERMFPLAQDASAKTGIPADVIFAQAALESNWGRSAPQNNYFGIKGKGGSQTTREFVNGVWTTITDTFRGYSSMEDSVKGYVEFINNPNSRRWGAAKNATTSEEAARALQANGYATDPQYSNKLMSIIRSVPADVRSATTGVANSLPSFTVPFTDASSGFGDAFDRMNELAKIGNEQSEGTMPRSLADVFRNITSNLSTAADVVAEEVKEANPLTGLVDFFKNLFSVDTGIRFVVVLIGLLALGAAIYSLVMSNGGGIARQLKEAI